VAVFLVVLVLAALSITPTVKLNSAPPSDFVALRASSAGSKAALAGGYWEVAAGVIQWKYSRTSTLPAQAPAEFALANSKPDKIEDQASRAAYWAKLREEWLRPENWHTTYGVDLNWPVRNAKSFSRAIKQFIDQP
jgi:hypothetical protein